MKAGNRSWNQKPKYIVINGRMCWWQKKVKVANGRRNLLMVRFFPKGIKKFNGRQKSTEKRKYVMKRLIHNIVKWKKINILKKYVWLKILESRQDFIGYKQEHQHPRKITKTTLTLQREKEFVEGASPNPNRAPISSRSMLVEGTKKNNSHLGFEIGKEESKSGRRV